MRTAATLGGVGRAGGAGNGTQPPSALPGLFRAGRRAGATLLLLQRGVHDFFAGPRAFWERPFMFLLVLVNRLSEACATAASMPVPGKLGAYYFGVGDGRCATRRQDLVTQSARRGDPPARTREFALPIPGATDVPLRRRESSHDFRQVRRHAVPALREERRRRLAAVADLGKLTRCNARAGAAYGPLGPRFPPRCSSRNAYGALNSNAPVARISDARSIGIG